MAATRRAPISPRRKARPTSRPSRFSSSTTTTSKRRRGGSSAGSTRSSNSHGRAAVRRPHPRLEDAGLLTGQGRFVDDVKLPGVLSACFVRSPHAHARIRAVDRAGALALPGVHAVLTADDLPARMATGQIPMLVPNPSIKTPRTQLALARDEVCYVGQTIAVVIADNRYLAEDAAQAVAVEFDVLPAVSDCRAAAEPGAPRVHTDLADNIAARVPFAYGDVDGAFARAAHVFEEELFLHRGGAMTLETRAVLASHDKAADMLTVWSSTQTPHLCRATLADLFARDLESIRVIAPSVGGGFGTKAPFYAEEAVIPAAAQKLGRPVKWVEHRRLPALGHHRPLYRGDHVSRAIRGAGISHGDHRRPHQPGADHGGARRRAAAGGVRDGTADGPGGARAFHRPRRNSPAQHDPARSDALLDRACVPRRQAAHLCGRRLSPQPGDGAGAGRLRGVPRTPATGAPRRPPYRDRHRQLRGGHRPRAVRGRHRACPAQRQGRGGERRHHPGTRHAHDTVADRRR